MRFEYNEEGQLIKRITRNKKNQLQEMGDYRNAVAKYQYYPSGKLKSVQQYNSKDLLLGGTTYTYDKTGDLDLITYYNGKTVSSTIECDFDNQHQLKEYIQRDQDGEKTYRVAFTYQAGQLSAWDVFSFADNDSKSIKKQLILDLEGWRYEDPLLTNAKFEESGKGTFRVEVDAEGKIIDVHPLEVEASTAFGQEVMQLLRGKKLKKDPSAVAMASQGKLEITIPSPFSELKKLDFIYHPKPYD